MRRAAAAVVVLAAGCATPSGTVRARGLEDAIEEGVEYLVRAQEADGSWGRGRETTTFDVMASVPGSHDAFRVGTTALCVMALREAGERRASAKGLEYLVRHDDARRATRLELYNVWAHTYALQALARAWKEGRDPRHREAAEREIAHLQRYETYLGGWNYYDFVMGLQVPSMAPTSFGTAAGLDALAEAREAGLAVPDALRRRALARLEEMRVPDGAFVYSSDLKYVPLFDANRDKGSLGRSQACNEALARWGSPKAAAPELREGLDRFFREHRFLEIGRKRQYPHEGWYMTAGYYFCFGHYYAARVSERLGGARADKDRLAALLLPLQEPDGSWWDFKFWDYHKPYGTAFTVMALLRCR
jgi:hypothetical protein